MNTNINFNVSFMTREITTFFLLQVYMHQGNCEHLFTFSEMRLVSPSDPLKPQHYPTHTAVAQNQTIYCTACAEFGAKWIIEGSDKVPFDPAFFCDMCLKKYLYKDGQKLGNFKAYSYKINEINILKPTHGRHEQRDFTEMDAPVSILQRKKTQPPPNEDLGEQRMNIASTSGLCS